MRFKLFFFILALSFLPSPVLAGFGVSPYYVYNQHLKPGSVYESEIILSRSDSNEDLLIKAEPEVGQISSWFTFKPANQFTFPKGQNRFPLKVVVTVPQDAKLDNYKGVIRVKATSSENAPAGGVSVVKGARLEVDLITTNIDVSQLTVEDIKADPVTQTDAAQKLMLHLKVRNDGNTAAGPTKVTIDLTDTLNNNITSLTNTNTIQSVPANETKIVDAEFTTNLNPGEYFASTRVFLNDSLIKEDRLVIKVLAPPPSARTLPLPRSLTSISPFSLYLLLILIIGCTISFVLYRLHKKTLSLIILLLTIAVFLLSLVFLNPANRIKGVSVQKSPAVDLPAKAPTTAPLPVQVTDPSGATYSIYQEASLASKVIYTARENEKMKVIDRSGDWYLVKTSNDLTGWLPSTSVKSTN